MKLKPEWLARFRQEASGHLRDITTGLDTLDWNRPGQARAGDEQAAEALLIRPLFIKAHSIKGTAAMLNMEQIAAAALELETLFGQAMSDPSLLGPALRENAAALIGQLQAQVAAIDVEDTSRHIYGTE